MVAAQTTTNVFHFSNELEHFLGEIPLYDPEGPCFFAFANAVYHHLSERHPDAVDEGDWNTIGYGVGTIYLRNGWMSTNTLHDNRAEMIPALVNMYHRFDGRDWTRFRNAVARVTTRNWVREVDMVIPVEPLGQV